jgi:hypothetical protein
MGHIIIGSEALNDGILTRHELQHHHRPVFTNVHAPKNQILTLQDRTYAAWLWTRRRGVVTGVAASALHGAEWVDTGIPLELIWNCTRPPRGLVVRNERLAEDERTCLSGIPTTSVARTAMDLGRFLARGPALARLDALMRAVAFDPVEVLALAERYRGARGVARLKAILPLVDGGAASPQETRLRLMCIDAGLPWPTTQIAVVDQWGRHVRTLDMGWEEFKVALEYDGDQHQTSRPQYVKDHWVLPKLRELGWNVIQVIREDRGADVVDSAYRALRAGGWDGQMHTRIAETVSAKGKFEYPPSGIQFRREAG